MIKKIGYSILSVLLATSVALAQQNLMKVRINDFTGGMNSNSLADILEPNQGASLVNISLDRKGKLIKRKGQALFNKDVDVHDVLTVPFRGIGRFDPDANTSYLMMASGTNIYRSLSTSSSWTYASPTSILTAGQDTEFVQANNLLFVLNGYDRTGWYTGNEFSRSATYPSSPPSAETGAWLRNYLFLAGATTNNDWVYFSNNLEPWQFDSGDIIPVSTGDGQKIQKLLPYRLNELIIYKERSVFVLDITGTTPLSDWTVQPISTVIGTIAPRSVVSLGNDQWFLSSEPIAVRSLIRTEYDKILVNRVSEPIQDILDGVGTYKLNTTHVNKAAAVLFNNKYILAIPEGTSTVNNFCLVYDFAYKAWYVIKGWFPASWQVFNNNLYYIDALDGRVIECFTGTMGDFPKGPSFIDSASDPSAAIEFAYVSRALDFDNPENYKMSDAIEVEFDPTGDYEASVYFNVDNEGWNNLGVAELEGQSTTLSITLPTVLANSGVARKTFQTQEYGEFKKCQIMVYNNASIETVTLQRITAFGDVKQWRRE